MSIKICLILCLALLLPLPAQVVHQIYFDRFTHYQPDDWVTYAPANEITSIDMGFDYIFFGTRNGGILRYNVYDNIWDFPYTTSNGLRSNYIRRIVYNHEEHRWYALTGAGIDVYNQAFKYWEPADVNALPDRRTVSGIEQRDFQNQDNFDFPPLYRPPNSELPDFFTKTDILFHPPDEIIDRHNRSFYLNDERIVDNWRRLWISTNGIGVAEANLNTWYLTVHQKSIPYIYPRDVFFDGDDIWIAGKAMGRAPAGITLWEYDRNHWEYFEAPFISGIFDDNTNSINGIGNYLFFATEQGLVTYHKKKKSWKTFTTGDGLESDRVNDLFVYEGIVYIGSDEGFNWFDPGYGKVEESNDRTLDNVPVYQITKWDSTVVFATDRGLYRYHPEADKVRFFETGSAIPDLRITAVEANNDALWLAGDYGITYYDRKEERWISFTNIKNHIYTRFNDIAFTENNVWFASGQGLLKYDIDRDYWYLYTTEDGLADNRVYHIDVDGDDLWLSTQKGVTLFRWYVEGRME